jgi:hypothetical protein
MPENKLISDKAYLEKKERIRIVVQQTIGLDKVIDLINEKYQVEVFDKNGTILLFVEEKEDEARKD